VRHQKRPETFAKPHVTNAQLLQHQQQHRQLQKGGTQSKDRGILMDQFKAGHNLMVSVYIRASNFVEEVAFEDRVYDVFFEQLKRSRRGAKQVVPISEQLDLVAEIAWRILNKVINDNLKRDGSRNSELWGQILLDHTYFHRSLRSCFFPLNEKAIRHATSKLTRKAATRGRRQQRGRQLPYPHGADTFFEAFFKDLSRHIQSAKQKEGYQDALIDWSDAGGESLQFHLSVLGKQHVQQMYQRQRHVEHERWYEQLVEDQIAGAGGRVAIAHTMNVKDLRLCHWAFVSTQHLMSFPTGSVGHPKRFAMGCLLLSIIACYIGHMHKYSSNPCWKKRFQRWKKFAQYANKDYSQSKAPPVPSNLAQQIMKDIHAVIEIASSVREDGGTLYSKKDIISMLICGTTLSQIKPLLQILALRLHIVSKEEGFCRIYAFPADEQGWSTSPIFVLMERIKQQRGGGGKGSKRKIQATTTIDYQLLSEVDNVAQPLHFNRMLKGRRKVVASLQQRQLHTPQLHFSAILNPQQVAKKVAGLKFCPTCCQFITLNKHHNINGKEHQCIVPLSINSPLLADNPDCQRQRSKRGTHHQMVEVLCYQQVMDEVQCHYCRRWKLKEPDKDVNHSWIAVDVQQLKRRILFGETLQPLDLYASREGLQRHMLSPHHLAHTFCVSAEDEEEGQELDNFFALLVGPPAAAAAV